MKIKLFTHNHIGDELISTALVRDIAISRPDIQVFFESNYSQIWQGNSNIKGSENYNYEIKLKYFGSQRQASSGHCIEGYFKTFKKEMNIEIPLTKLGVDVYLSDKEKKENVFGKYWLINGGYQKCSGTKAYPFYQDIVDKRKDIKFIQIGGNSSRDIHLPLDNVINLIGKTSIRDLIQLVYHADGIISPPSACVHLASIETYKQRKCVVICGGREPEKLTKYSDDFKMISRFGQLDCCKKECCMKFFLHKVDSRTCPNQILINNIFYPKCMSLISAEEIVDKI